MTAQVIQFEPRNDATIVSIDEFDLAVTLLRVPADEPIPAGWQVIALSPDGGETICTYVQIDTKWSTA